MLSKRARLWLGLIVTLGLLSVASSCSKAPEGTADDGKDTGGTSKAYASKGDEGTVTGKVTYTGAAPEGKKIDTSADAACTSKSPNLTTEEWAVKDGKVANTFVYIKDGTLADGSKIGDWSFEAPKTAATLDQNGCHYKPHVMGVVVKQDITITNSDPTTHNIHFTGSKNPDWNQSQANGAAAMTHKLNNAEVLVPVKCNQHPWMKAYVGVLRHPLFAVSGEDGSFTIKGVPPGKYNVVAWHEGGANGTEKTMEVTVPAKGAATADFAFGSTAALRGQPSSMPVVSAIEVPMAIRH
ncbi:MAG: carboxypeptidase regulatory-like domain-containing protein [Acidobacteriota bacterium]